MYENIKTAHRIIPASFLETLTESDEKARASKLKDLANQLAGKKPFIPASILVALIRAGEAALILAAGFLTYVSYIETIDQATPVHYITITTAVSLFMIVVSEASGLYSIRTLLQPFSAIPRLFGILLVGYALALASIVFSKTGIEFSRIWLISWFITSTLLIVFNRLAVSRLVARMNSNGQFDRRAVLVGGGQPAEQLLSALEQRPETDVSIIGVFDDRNDKRSPVVVSGYAKLGSIQELRTFVRQTRVDVVIVTLPLNAEKRLLELVKPLWELPVDICLSAYNQKFRYNRSLYTYLGPVPLLSVLDRPLAGWDWVLKAVEDRVVAAFAIIALLPVMALVAMAVKLESRGPVLFRQKRYGFNNELIEVLKFRSMYTHACDASASKLVTRGDPRVTRVGRFIRRTSLDELPQLFNVLKGELSLVGPRPHATQAKARDSLYDEVVEGYFARHKVKPGITGWAQVEGWRGETDTVEKIQKRVEHDLYYIENWSLWFDLYILAKTPFSLISGKSAY